MKKLRTLALAATSAALLGACGSAPDPLRSFRTQQLDWQTCDASILGGTSARTEERFAALGERLKCADMRAPLDWSNPARGEVSVTLIRAAAADQQRRQGAIFFNPGGPGGDGLAFAPNYAFAWGEGDSEDPVQGGLKALQEQYDLIGFSPRGVGNSTRLYCGSNKTVTPIYGAASDRSEANIQKMIHEGQLYAEACQKNPATPFINTDATARDMNLARQLLGEQKLNYIGYSYGTWLGSWYAKLFPEQTGRFLLDGNMPWADRMQKNWETDPLAFTRALREMAAPYLARHADEYSLPADSEAIYQIAVGLSEPLRTAVSSISGNLLYSGEDYPLIGVLIRTAQELDTLIVQKPDADEGEIMAAFEMQDLFSDPAAQDASFEVAEELLNMRRMYLDQRPEQVFLDGSMGTMVSVMCNDTEWTKDLNYWRTRDDQDAQQYPLFGGDLLSLACVHWKGGPTVQKPGVPEHMPPLLMLQNEYDPATPREGAIEAMNSVPDSRMIFIDNEPAHTAFPYGTDCVDLPIIRYFLDGTLPMEKVNYCQARPLPGEDQVYNAGEDYAGAAGLSQQSLRRPLSAGAQAALQDNRELITQGATQLRHQR